MPDKTRIVGNLVSDNNILSNVTTDNTGIGTTNPTSKLHVVGNVRITGIVTATSFVGIGSSLTNVRVGIQSNNTNVGLAETINFIGAGVSSVTLSNNVVTVNIPATIRTVNTYTATLNQTTFSATYNLGFVDVYLNGSKLSQDQYTATSGTSIVLETGASSGDIVEIVGYVTYRVPGTQLILTDTISGSSGIVTSYTGIADQGSSQSAAVWTIRRSVFTSAGITSSTGTATNVAWINRTTVVYT